jgi:hypothetical protein
MKQVFKKRQIKFRLKKSPEAFEKFKCFRMSLIKKKSIYIFYYSTHHIHDFFLTSEFFDVQNIISRTNNELNLLKIQNINNKTFVLFFLCFLCFFLYNFVYYWSEMSFFKMLNEKSAHDVEVLNQRLLNSNK